MTRGNSNAFSGRVALVTGAGSGIGRALVTELANRGASVAAAAYSADEIAELGALQKSSFGTVTVFSADITDREAVNAMATDVERDHGPVDLLINCAGMAIVAQRIDAVPMDQFDRILAVNLFGAVNVTMAFLPQLLKHQRANIVNVASSAALAALPNQTPYTTSKFGLRGFSEGLRLDLSGMGVDVTTVYPGPTETGIIANSPYYTDKQKVAINQHLSAMHSDTAAYVAAKIIDGIVRKRARVLTGSSTSKLDILARLRPGSYTDVMRRQTQKMLKR